MMPLMPSRPQAFIVIHRHGPSDRVFGLTLTDRLISLYTQGRGSGAQIVHPTSGLGNVAESFEPARAWDRRAEIWSNCPQPSRGLLSKW